MSEAERRRVIDLAGPLLAGQVKSRTSMGAGCASDYLWLPQFKQVRRLPEFKTLLREIGIAAYWQEYGWPAVCRPLPGDDFECD